MEKPQQHKMIYWDYHECREFLEQKYGYEERDYAKRWKPQPDPTKPYQDFWHFVVDRAPITGNGCYFTMHEEWRDGAEPWQKEIIDRYLLDFGEIVDGSLQVEFYAAW